MSELTDFLFMWIPVFVILGFSITGLLYYTKIKSSQKIVQIKEDKKQKKESETFGGAINELITSAPSNLKQIESEIATIQEKAIKEHLTPEQTKSLLSRLESERDMLRLASKYGHLAKPLTGSIGKLLERVVGGIAK